MIDTHALVFRLRQRLPDLSEHLPDHLPWTPLERRWRDEVLAAVIPERGTLPGLDGADTEAFWRRCTTAAPPLLQFGLRGGVWLLTFCPPLVIGKPKLFFDLSRADQDRVLEWFHHSPLYLARQIAMMLQLMGCFAYMNDPAVRSQLDPTLEENR